MPDRLAVGALLHTAMAAPFPVYQPAVAGFYQMMEYHLGWRDQTFQPQQADSGKLIRPQLCLLACRIAGSPLAQALPVAAALQLLHDFTLVHDDIEDRSDQRRGRTTAWRLWGEAQGINMGDGMFALCHLALAQMVDSGVPAERCLAIFREFDQIILKICEGQYLDISFETRLDLNEQDYLAMIERKTAVLIAGSLKLGALAGGASNELADLLWQGGLTMGLAFQIEDDLLGIWGDPVITGKPYAADLYRRKKSLPIVYALAHAEPADQAMLRQIYSQDEVSDSDVEILLKLLEHVGARAYTAAEAAQLHMTALGLLDVLPGDPEAIGELRKIAHSLLGRNK